MPLCRFICYNPDMTNDQFDDLKQFITATVSQSEARLEARLKEEIHQSVAQLEENFYVKIAQLEAKVDDGFAGIGEAIEQLHHIIDERDAAVERRLVRLEQRAA